MTPILPSHFEYKDSGLPWLGRVPAHWQLERAKWLYRQMARPVRESDEVVTCFRDGTVALRKKRRTLGFTNSLKEIGYQGVRLGDLVIHAMDAFAGAVGVSDSDGKCTPVYAVCTARRELDNRYYAYVVREMARSAWILALARGIRERSTDFRFDTFGGQLVPVPPLDEQRAIADYLDAHAVAVRRFIHNRQRLIEVLNEQKQAIINRAVTRGLDPDVPMKPSGGEWLGEIPEHWEIVPLRRVIMRAVDGPHHSPNYVDDGVTFISARNIKVNGWSLDDAKCISAADYKEFSRRIKPEPGDVLYTKGGTTGVARAVDLDFPFQVWVHVAVLKLRRSVVDPQYLALVLNSTPCYEQSQLFTRGATNQDLGLNRMKGIVLTLPPTLEEQTRIVSSVDQRSQGILAAIHRTEREIDLIREYRTRLIADVVTGKVDVRGVVRLRQSCSEGSSHGESAQEGTEGETLEYE